MMKTVLFLCTGNYYRSRFAEVLFNHAAAERGLAWRAASRGLWLQDDNFGPMSRQAIRWLSERGIVVGEPVRFPQAVTAAELEAADLVVAVKEEEHRPLLEDRFPAFRGPVEFWQIHDVYDAPPEEILPLLAEEVGRLIERLQRKAANELDRG
jgi:protein-tyrosine phosphatase